MSGMFNKGGVGKVRGFGFGGFAMKAKKPEDAGPPIRPGMPRPAPKTSERPKTTDFAPPAKRRMSQQQYFDEDEEDDYQHARNQANSGAANDSDSDDPLDAFMAGIESEISKKPAEDKKPKKGVREDLEEEDDQESYFNYIKNLPQQVDDEDEIEIEYDEDGNPIVPEKSKIIDPLPPIDHSLIAYMPVEKFFYNEHEDIKTMTPHAVFELRNKLGIKVSGASPTRPVTSFAHFGFDEPLMNIIRKSEYTQPTSIQCQAVPTALSGRDIIGIAKTGSGKTAAYLWPLLVHLMDQEELVDGDGPIGLIAAPTRELCQQIYHEAKRFGKAYNLRVCCVYGGGSKWEQSQALKTQPEILVCTPGRMIDLVKIKATNLQRVSFLVIDEADRMFDMGFEAQVRSICNHVRPDRQTLMFSATFRRKVEKLARDALTDPVRIVIGDLGEANQDITQVVEVLRKEEDKWSWLQQRLVSYTSLGSVLIFVTRKANSEEIAAKLKTKDFSVGLLHGDMGQADRDSVITSFKRKDIPIMVATDVAARGLDIPSIRTVVNYDVARDIDTHTHRIGRTGRAGEKGHAFTLLTSKDSNFAGDLVRNMEQANQNVPEDLMRLAMTNSWFRKSRFKQGKGGFGGGGGKGRGRVRPSFGGGEPDRPGLGVQAAQTEPDDQVDEEDDEPNIGTLHSSSKLKAMGTSMTATMARLQQQSSGGQGTMGSRLSNMRTAFAAGYNRFKSASDATLSSTMATGKGGVSFVHSSTSAGSSTSTTGDQGAKKRKSRWD